MLSPVAPVPGQVVFSGVDARGQTSRPSSPPPYGLSSQVVRCAVVYVCMCRRPGLKFVVYFLIFSFGVRPQHVRAVVSSLGRATKFLFILLFFSFLRLFFSWSHPSGRQGCSSGRGDVFRPAKHYRPYSRVPGIRPAPPALRSAGEVSFL